MEKKEKNYLPSNIKEITTQYGTMYVANIKLDSLQKIENNGWVSICICKRREPSAKGATHYAYENTFEPQNKDGQKPNETVKSKEKSDLPF